MIHRFHTMAHDTSRDTEQKRWSWRKWLGAFVLIMMSGCLVAVVWVVWELKNWEPFTARSYYPSRPDSSEISFIEGNADITLPPSAHDIYVYSTGFREIDTRVRFSMSANELDEFMKSTLCQEPLGQIEPGQESTSGGTSEWWMPNQAERLKGCSGTGNYSYQMVRIDMTDPRVYVVFVSTSVH